MIMKIKQLNIIRNKNKIKIKIRQKLTLENQNVDLFRSNLDFN